jgi:hypothetical protein
MNGFTGADIITLLRYYMSNYRESLLKSISNDFKNDQKITQYELYFYI